MSKKLARNINQALKSRFPIIYILGSEEDRIEETLASMAQSLFKDKSSFVSWSGFDGFSDKSDCRDPLEALHRLKDAKQPGIFLFKDLPVEFDNPKVIRALRDLYYELKNKNIVLVISHPALKIPELLNTVVYLIEMSLPTKEEAFLHIKSILKANTNTNLTDDEVQQFSIAMLGLTLSGIEHFMSRFMQSEVSGAKSFIPELLEEKTQILKKESVLEFVPIKQSLEQIGGLDNLKEWVLERKHLFSNEGLDSGLPMPSGILFMGVSGCGKSMAAKAVAKAWNIPLVRLDMSLVLSGAYGPPETAFTHATHIAEQIAPIVLWIDELENSLGFDDRAGSKQNVNIFSSFLTWMQEKPSGVFLAATANRIQELPAELLRKGRFDQLFFLDLPNKSEREHIISIHLALQGANAEDFDLSYLAASTKDWSGAEIEQAVKSARIQANMEKRKMTDRDVGHTAAGMVPLAHTMREQIKAIKQWSIDRAVPASRGEK
ncbi:MAG: AAA family ATPase [Gammaproteobacteria bacterium]|nr:AAA family ATPase [Gammaproteobacteria bacterium]